MIPIAILWIFFSQRSTIQNQLVESSPYSYTISETPISLPVSFVNIPKGDFSCQPSECWNEVEGGINGIPYPSCNPLVQINNTGAANPKACDYWKIQQKYFGEEDYVNLSEMSKNFKSETGESIIDGFLGMDNDIQLHRKAVSIFLNAEKEFNQKYGLNRIGSTYYLPSYPNGYTFEFGGSLNKRGVRGTSENLDGLLYEGQYITPSQHFWGVAIDFNTPTNYGNRFGAKCSINIPPEFVSIFESNGLRWGGRFFSDTEDVKYFDPMHFEFLPDCIDPNFINL